MRISMLTLVMLLAFPAACTRQTVEQDEPGKRTPNGERQSSDEDSHDGRINDGTTSVPVVLDERSLKQAYTIDTSNMRYKFEYLSSTSEGEIKFEGGKARLDFKNLKDGTSGDLTLTLSEGTTAKLRGVRKDLVLSKGQNNIQLVMKLIDGSGNGSTTDLVINVELDQQQGGGNTPPVNPPSPPVNPPSPPVNPPSPPVNPPNPPPANPPTPPVTPPNPPSTGGGIGGGDPSATSFARDIKPILEAHCTECHHSGAQRPDLTAKAPTESGIDRVIARIEGTSRPMPPSPRDRVSSKEVEKLRSWKSQGFRP